MKKRGAVLRAMQDITTIFYCGFGNAICSQLGWDHHLIQ
jgi:hypothetical protein